MNTTTEPPAPKERTYIGQAPGRRPPPPEPKRPGPMEPKVFTRFLKPDAYLPNLVSTEKPQILEEMLSALKQRWLENECRCIHELLLAREQVGTTALGKGLAVPHARTALVTNLSVVIGRSAEGVDYGAPDRKPVHVFFLVLGPNEDPSQLYLSFLSTIVKVFKTRAMKRRLLSAGSFEELVGMLEDALARE